MARIEPLSRESLSDHEAGFQMVEAAMGFVPNSMFTMARVPGVLPAFSQLGAAVLGNPLIPRELSQMIALVSSIGSGCQYCQAHTGHSAERLGVSEDKLADIWNFETSDHFDEAERSALAIAFHAGMSRTRSPTTCSLGPAPTTAKTRSPPSSASSRSSAGSTAGTTRWPQRSSHRQLRLAKRVISTNGWESGKHA